MAKFKAVKAEIDQKKLEGNEFSYNDLINFHYMILSLFVDFGRKEVAVLQDLWHFKVSKLLKDIKKFPGDNDEEISCDTPRYWLDEAIIIDVVKDPKFRDLDDLVDDIDNIQKAFRFCQT